MSELTKAEASLWSAWNQAQESVRAAVATEVSAVTGLSDPDFDVLDRVIGEGGAMRQNELAAALGWHRSRLSHHLSRMADRGLVARSTVPGGVRVSVTRAGRAQLTKTRPIHDDAVRRHLVARVPRGQRADLVALLERLAGASA